MQTYGEELRLKARWAPTWTCSVPCCCMFYHTIAIERHASLLRGLFGLSGPSESWFIQGHRAGPSRLNRE